MSEIVTSIFSGRAARDGRDGFVPRFARRCRTSRWPFSLECVLRAPTAASRSKKSDRRRASKSSSHARAVSFVFPSPRPVRSSPADFLVDLTHVPPPVPPPSDPTGPLGVPFRPFLRVPAEILLAHHSGDSHLLFSTTLVSRFWNACAIPLLYRQMNHVWDSRSSSRRDPPYSTSSGASRSITHISRTGSRTTARPPASERLSTTCLTASTGITKPGRNSGVGR